MFLRLLILTLILASFSSVHAQEPAPKFIIKGYGETIYSYFDYGPDQRSGLNGSPSDSRAIMDIPRVVTEMKYYFDSSMYVEFEVEYEHGGTGSALELEFEEFGEFEQEVEKGGEILVEQFYLKKTFAPTFSVQLGHFTIPIGMLNRFDKPTDFLTVSRPEAARALIPVSWHETGLALSGSWKNLGYRLGLVNGLDGTGFSSKFWVRDGYQGRFEQVDATDLAYFLHANYSGFKNFHLAGSFYRGNTSGNRPKDDMEGIDAHVTIAEAHARYQNQQVRIYGQFLYGDLANSDRVTRSNSLLSNNLGVARTPVAANATLYSIEGAFNLFALNSSSTEGELLPFLRYEHYNSMEDVEGLVFADPRFERNVITAGINFLPNKNVVFKAEYAHRTLGDSKFNDENTISIGFGIQGEFLNVLSTN
ncbi:MAG: hypothetical protein ACRBF0_16790 [Calditrichia bacterium]